MTVSGIITTYAGNGIGGSGGDGGAATSAQLNSPWGASADSNGNVYIADRLNNRIRKVDSSGIISTYAGNGYYGYGGDGGDATSATLNYPYGLFADLHGNVYIADTGNDKIRMVSITGIITTIAGTGIYGIGAGTTGSTGDGGAATSAQLDSPLGVTIDGNGNVYIADSGNGKIRMVSTSGIITTYAGKSTQGSSGDNGVATSAQLNYPFGVSTDIPGNVYIADSHNQAIRKVFPRSTTSFPTPTPTSIPLSYQQTYLKILEYTDSACTVPVFGFAVTMSKCITMGSSALGFTSMTVTYNAATGAVLQNVYTSQDCSGTSTPQSYTLSASPCSALSTSGLYYTVTTNSFSTFSSAIQAVTVLGSGAVMSAFEDSACTLQSTKSDPTNGLPSVVSGSVKFLLRLIRYSYPTFVCLFICLFLFIFLLSKFLYSSRCYFLPTASVASTRSR